MKGGRVPIHIMRWAPADFENDEAVKLAGRRRNYRALAFYMAFLNHSFMAGGDLPEDPERIAATLGWHRGDVEAALRYWLAEGKLIASDGRISHSRVVREVREELAYRADQSALGKKGGEAAGRGRPKASIGVPLIEDRGTPTESIGPPCAVRRAPAPTPAPDVLPAPSAPASPPPVSVEASVVQAPANPLQKPVPASRETWLTPFGDDWTEAYGGAPSWGELARVLKQPVAALGEAEVRSRWRLYLGQTDGRYASPTRFAQTIGVWTDEAIARMQPRDMRSMTVGDFNAQTYERVLKRLRERDHAGQGTLAAKPAQARGLLPDPAE